MITQTEIYNMYIRNIYDYDSFDDLKHTILTNNKINIENTTLDKIQAYFKKYGRKPKYWMLISNPSKWDSGFEQFMVNEYLYSLDEVHWKINERTGMNIAMKVGDLGIIKVSDDTRSILNRLNDKGEEVKKLDSGIYAIFEVVKDKDNEATWKSEDGLYYVNIKIINNLFTKNKHISKDKSIELLGENLYKSIPSTKMDKSVFDKVITYIDTNKC